MEWNNDVITAIIRSKCRTKCLWTMTEKSRSIACWILNENEWKHSRRPCSDLNEYELFDLFEVTKPILEWKREKRCGNHDFAAIELVELLLYNNNQVYKNK